MQKKDPGPEIKIPHSRIAKTYREMLVNLFYMCVTRNKPHLQAYHHGTKNSSGKSLKVPENQDITSQKGSICSI